MLSGDNGSGIVRDQRLVDAGETVVARIDARVRRIEYIQHIGQPRPRVFQRLAKANQLSSDRRGLGTAQTHDPNTSAPRRRGDGGNGVGIRLLTSHTL